MTIQQTNRLLLGAVVSLALCAGYLYSKDQGWLASPGGVGFQVDLPQLNQDAGTTIHLPGAEGLTNLPLRLSLQTNTPRHAFTDSPITLTQLGAVTWAAQGQITPWGDRTAPSYKATFPLKLRVVVRRVDGIAPGVYAYSPQENQLHLISQTTHITNQTSTLAQAPAIIALSLIPASQPTGMDFIETKARQWETGQVVENIYLALQNLGLAGVMVADYHAEWNTILDLASGEELQVLIPIGQARDIQVVPETYIRPEVSVTPFP